MRNSPIFFGGNEGSIVVEFAIIIPVVFTLTFAMLDINRFFLAEVHAKDIVRDLSDFYRYEMSSEALESVSLSQVQTKAITLAEIGTGGLPNVSDISVSVETYQNISDMLNGFEEENQGLHGAAGNIVKYTLHYSVMPLTPFADYFYPSDAVEKTVTLVSINAN